MSTLTRQSHGYQVTHSRSVKGKYPASRTSHCLIPVSVRQTMAPAVHKAKLTVDMAAAAAGDTALHVWNWRRLLGMDDRIEIMTDHAADDAAFRGEFAGFIVDVNIGVTRSEGLSVTAVSNAFRLLRDQEYLVYGRGMITTAGDWTHANGLPCVFNAGGRPNCHPDLCKSLVEGCYANDRFGGVPLFCADDADNAVYWTFGKILNYLLWGYNSDEKWITNCELAPADYESGPPLVVDVEGRSLWEALAAVADRAGYDLFEEFVYGAGKVDSVIEVVKRHEGEQITVKHQSPARDGSLAELDLDKTDLFAADIAESCTSCVTAPVVAAGRTLIELTVPLQPAWDPAALAAPTGGVQYPTAGGGTAGMEDYDYCKRYVVGGCDFDSYADAGRLWDANTDSRYNGQPYSLTTPDMGLLAGDGAGSWPPMAFAPRRLLSTVNFATAAEGDAAAKQPLGRPLDHYIELSFDGGSSWRKIEAALLPDRLAVRLQHTNLAGVAEAGGTIYDNNLFEALTGDDADDVKMRLTVTVESPYRNLLESDRRPGAGTAFATSGPLVRRGAIGRIRTVASSSRFYDYPGSLPVTHDTLDEETATADLEAVADGIIDALGDRFIEASLPIEWPDHNVKLGQCVTRIEGIEYNLGVGAGPASEANKKYPRVVGVQRLLTPGAWRTNILLDTFRKAGVK